MEVDPETVIGGSSKWKGYVFKKKGCIFPFQIPPCLGLLLDKIQHRGKSWWQNSTTFMFFLKITISYNGMFPMVMHMCTCYKHKCPHPTTITPCNCICHLSLPLSSSLLFFTLTIARQTFSSSLSLSPSYHPALASAVQLQSKSSLKQYYVCFRNRFYLFNFDAVIMSFKDDVCTSFVSSSMHLL